MLSAALSRLRLAAGPGGRSRSTLLGNFGSSSRRFARGSSAKTAPRVVARPDLRTARLPPARDAQSSAGSRPDAGGRSLRRPPLALGRLADRQLQRSQSCQLLLHQRVQYQSHALGLADHSAQSAVDRHSRRIPRRAGPGARHGQRKFRGRLRGHQWGVGHVRPGHRHVRAGYRSHAAIQRQQHRHARRRQPDQRHGAELGPDQWRGQPGNQARLRLPAAPHHVDGRRDLHHHHHGQRTIHRQHSRQLRIADGVQLFCPVLELHDDLGHARSDARDQRQDRDELVGHARRGLGAQQHRDRAHVDRHQGRQSRRLEHLRYGRHCQSGKHSDLHR